MGYQVLPFPSLASSPRLLSFYKLKAQINHAKSTLLKVFFLKRLKPLEINTFEKQRGGSPLWLTNCCKKVYFAPRALFSTTYGNPILQLFSFQFYAGMGGTPPSRLQRSSVATFRLSDDVRVYPLPDFPRTLVLR
jgi:hypothetical protein